MTALILPTVCSLHTAMTMAQLYWLLFHVNTTAVQSARDPW